jgi:prohibitin 1
MITGFSQAGTIIRNNRKNIWLYYRQNSLAINLSLLVTISLAIALWPCIFVTVPAGHVAVKWYRLFGGTDTRTIYGEGGHLVWPWDNLISYDARVQQVSRDFDVLTRDGLTMTVNMALRFRLNDAMVGLLHKHVGTDYVDTLLVSAVGSDARHVFSQNSADDIYTERRMDIQREIKDAVIRDLDHNFGQETRQKVAWIFLDEILIRSMHFPPEVQAAVNRKMEQYQLKQEYMYRLQREELESQRKEVEARGIAQFQSIVGAGISDTYLRWKGIDATLALAQSSNAKVVIIGTGKDGMPLILGAPEAQPPVPLSAPPPTAPSSDDGGWGTDAAEHGKAHRLDAPPVDRRESAEAPADPTPVLGGVIDTLHEIARTSRPDARQFPPASSSAVSDTSVNSNSVTLDGKQ